MNVQRVKITRIYKSDKGRDGKEFRDKNGKVFWKVAIQTDKTGQDWYSCLAFRSDSREYNLNEGQETDIVLEDTGQYKNFKIPTRFDLLEMRVKNLEEMLLTSSGDKVPDFSEIGQKNDVAPDDIPF